VIEVNPVFVTPVLLFLVIAKPIVVMAAPRFAPTEDNRILRLVPVPIAPLPAKRSPKYQT
jgi:hypothetical protein